MSLMENKNTQNINRNELFLSADSGIAKPKPISMIPPMSILATTNIFQLMLLRQ